MLKKHYIILPWILLFFVACSDDTLPQPTSTAMQEAAEQPCAARFLVSEAVLLREAAPDAPILFTLAVTDETPIEVLQGDDAWVQVSISGAAGWVSSSDISTDCIENTLATPLSATEVSLAATNTPVVIAATNTPVVIAATNTPVVIAATNTGQSAGNQPPVVDPIPNQNLVVGESLLIPVPARDPEGFNVTFEEVESSSEQIARVAPDGEGNLLVEGLSQGQVNVRFRVSDGNGGATSSIFVVEVLAATPPPSRPPIVEAIPNQSLVVGEQLIIQVEGTDPDGTNIFLKDVESAAETIASINAGTDRKIAIRGVSAGEALLSVTVADGNAGETTISFNVRVLPSPSATPNLPPVIQAVTPPTLLVGSTLLVPIIFSDPEGSNPFFSDVQSSSSQIVEAAGDGEGNIVLEGVSAGQAEVRFVVEDNFGGKTTNSFRVTVLSPTETPNLPPVVEAIPDQSVTVGQFLLVELNARDPEGFNVFLDQLRSSAESILNVETDGNNNVVLEGVSVGQATVTARIADGSGGQTSLTFNVQVLPEPTASPNLPPVVDPIPDQLIKQDQFVDVQVTAYDPEGFNPFIGFVYVEDTQIVSYQTLGNNRVRFNGLAGGESQVGISVDDGNGASFTVTFMVRVEGRPPIAPNQAPQVSPIAAQRVGVGQTIAVFVDATDPEGFNLFFAEIKSAAPTIAEAGAAGDGNIWVTGVSAGSVEITAIVDDSQGGQTPVSFSVEVFETARPDAGAAPEIEPIPPQTLFQGEFLPLAITAIDPEGSAVTLMAASSSEAIAPVQLTEGGITVFGAGVGDTSISVIASDAQGAASSVVFLVSVLPAAVPDLNTLPVLPVLSDEAMESLRELATNATGEGVFLLGNVADVEDQAQLVVGESTDPAWLLADWLDADNNPAACTAANPLLCALESPAFALVLLGANDAEAQTPLADFQADLQILVDEFTRQNVIPVLTTIPGEAALLDLYNQIIVKIAEANRIPVVNLWLAQQTEDADESYAYLWEALAGLNEQLSE